MLYLYMAITAVIVLLIISNTKLSVTKRTLTFNDLPKEFDGFKIVQLSDLHSKVFGKKNDILIDKVRKLKPDIIVCTGDMIDKFRTTFDSLYALTEQLLTICPVYYTTGNHETMIAIEAWEQVQSILKEQGVIVLSNTMTAIERDDASIDLYGFRLPLQHYKGVSKEYSNVELTEADILRVFPNPSKERFSILLAHHPRFFTVYAEWGADLILSGHQHGGLIRLPFLGGVLSTEVAFFPKYDAGVYKENDSILFVSRGLASGRFKFRFLNRPEIALIVLKNKLNSEI